MNRSSIKVIGNQDIRCEQRFLNFNKAIQQLGKFIDKGDLNELESRVL